MIGIYPGVHADQSSRILRSVFYSDMATRRLHQPEDGQRRVLRILLGEGKIPHEESAVQSIVRLRICLQVSAIDMGVLSSQMIYITAV